MYNVMSSTYIDGFAVNKTTQGICNTQYKSETNMTIEFTTEHDKILTDIVFHSTHDVHKCIGEQILF